ncbi:MAG: hypothetical protein ABJN26_20915 [Stappiaceae bacterium]
MSDDITSKLEFSAPSIPHDPSEVILIGHHLNTDDTKKNVARLQINISSEEYIEVTVQTIKHKAGATPDATTKKEKVNLALIKAYLFEGHLYKLPRPKIMSVSNEVENLDPNSKKPQLSYWRMNKLERALEVSIEDGVVDQLVLEANLPGKRANGSYAANMQLGHRSGRLTS